MRVLGIDPGSLNCGYGLISDGDGTVAIRRSARRLSPYQYLSSGRIVLPPRRPLSERLRVLHQNLLEVIDDCRPDEVVIEKIFFAKGIKAALSLGHTRGVVMLTAALKGLRILEYSPLEVKKAVVGYGRADKGQVQHMVREILGIGHSLSSDSADALALALCHVNARVLIELVAED